MLQTVIAIFDKYKIVSSFLDDTILANKITLVKYRKYQTAGNP